jgi:hypothetical protein
METLLAQYVRGDADVVNGSKTINKLGSEVAHADPAEHHDVLNAIVDSVFGADRVTAARARKVVRAYMLTRRDLEGDVEFDDGDAAAASAADADSGPASQSSEEPAGGAGRAAPHRKRKRHG